MRQEEPQQESGEWARVWVLGTDNRGDRKGQPVSNWYMDYCYWMACLRPKEGFAATEWMENILSLDLTGMFLFPSSLAPASSLLLGSIYGDRLRVRDGGRIFESSALHKDSKELSHKAINPSKIKEGHAATLKN